MRVWVDCTAAAHPLVLRPVIERLEARGHEVLVTTREYGQTVGILERLGIDYRAVGRHAGSGVHRKAVALAGRSARLLRLVGHFRPDVAVGHGSVDLAVVAALLRVPSVQMQDYEYAGLQRRIAFRLARRVLAPEAIPPERLARIGAPESKVVRYPGLKEDYYLADFVADRSVLDLLDLDADRMIVVLRPPPETSAYHAPNALFDGILRRLAGAAGVQAVVIPRTEAQARAARSIAAGVRSGTGTVAGGNEAPGPEQAPDAPDSELPGGALHSEQPAGAPEPARMGQLIVPDRAIDAQSLIAFADLVVSAGGTMNREAVALGAPVYTTFTGRLGGVDEQLIAEDRLRVLSDPCELPLPTAGRSASRHPQPLSPVNPRDPDLLVDAILTAVGPRIPS